jgi:hypothetical protein
MKKVALLLALALIILAIIPVQAVESKATVAAKSTLQPVLFYSDLVSGPNTGGQDNKGVFVTIWGKNFGAKQGTSFVTIGGGKVSGYPVWTDTQIVFQLGGKAKTGNITVTVNGKISNGLPFTVRAGNIYFVKTNGKDKNKGSWTSPWRTLTRAHNIRPGDTVYICNGITQLEEDANDAAIDLDSSGTEDKPMALIAYPGAKVVVGTNDLKFGIRVYINSKDRASNWVISKLNLTGFAVAIDFSDGMRVVGNKITAPMGGNWCAAICGWGSKARILGNDLYNCGTMKTKMYHMLYISNKSGVKSSDTEIGWNTFRNSDANRAIHIYADNGDMAPVADISIHDNLFKNIRGNAIMLGDYCTGNFYIYNNIIDHCAMGPAWPDGDTEYSGIYIFNTDAKVYISNNVLYNCGYTGGEATQGERDCSGVIDIRSMLPGYEVHVTNNIFYQTEPKGNPFSYETPIHDASPVTGENRNVFYGSGPAPSWDTAAINADPLFINAAKGDFRLKSNSPAINAGLNPVDIMAVKDIAGTVRLQGKSCNIGAYENALNGKPIVAITSPQDNLNIVTGEKVKITAEGINCKNMTFYADDKSAANKTGNSNTFEYIFTTDGKHYICVAGKNDKGVVVKTVPLTVNVAKPG